MASSVSVLHVRLARAPPGPAESHLALVDVACLVTEGMALCSVCGHAHRVLSV